MLQERIIILSEDRLLALTLASNMDHEPPSRDLAQAYAFVGTDEERADCLELVSEPWPADPKQAAALEKDARGQEQVAEMYRGKKMEAQYLENAARYRAAAQMALQDSRLLPREAWALDERRVLLGYQQPLQPRWFRAVDIEAGRELDRFSIPDLLPALSGHPMTASGARPTFDPLTSKTRVLCARGDLLLVDAVPGRKLLQRSEAGWTRVGEIENRYATHGLGVPVAGGFALDLQPESDKNEVAYTDGAGTLTARWPRKKQFVVTMTGTAPPSGAAAFGHLGGEVYVADAASGQVESVPALLGLGKEDLATPRLSPSARYVATFKHYGGDRIALFDRDKKLSASLSIPAATMKRADGARARPMWSDVSLEEGAVVVLAGGQLVRTPFDALAWAPPPPPPPKFKKLGTPLETIDAAVKSGPLAPVAELVRGLHAASVALTPSPQKSDLPVGASKFNGAPDLGAGAEWPRWRGAPMAFLAQIDLAEAHAVAPDLGLPASGLLSFFLAFDTDCGVPSFFSDANAEAGGARVLYTPADSRLVRMAPPIDLPREDGVKQPPVCKLKFGRGGAVLPQLSHSALQLAALSPEQANAYEALADLVNGKDEDPKQWGARLGGYPALLQNDDLHLEAESRQRGDAIDSQKGALWQGDAFQRAALGWRQLLQMDEGVQGWTWGDAGLMHWIARSDEFAEGAFGTVWTISVCH